jgi:hypothetical protein
MNAKIWIQAGIGFLIAYGLFFEKDGLGITQSQLVGKPITLKKLSDVGVRNSELQYSLRAADYPCEFMIDLAGSGASGWNIEKALAPGDEVEVGIAEKNVGKIRGKHQVKIYYLKKDGQYIFHFEGYKKALRARDARYDILGYAVLAFLAVNIFRAARKESQVPKKIRRG